MPGASKWGSEFLANSTITGHQYATAITALRNGRFAVVWADQSNSGDDTSLGAVRGQVFNAGGSKVGAEFLVNTITTNFQDQPAVTALSDGRFVVAWTDRSQTDGDTSGNAVRAQAYNADGSRSGSEFLVNTTTEGSQAFPSITALSDGRFVVAWSDESLTVPDTSLSAVRGQVFNADGSKAGAEDTVILRNSPGG